MPENSDKMKTENSKPAGMLLAAVVAALVLCFCVVWVHASKPSVSSGKISTEASFHEIDTNGDGSIDREEFAVYLQSRNQSAATSGDGKTCPSTGLPCSGGGGGGGGCGGSEEGGCCSMN